MVVFAAQGDARRSMALLWRAAGPGSVRTGPGPKPALSIDMIVDAGIAIADAEGMAALSMRAVGERLGRTAMALYTYVPSKSELVDLMYDQVLIELPTGYDLSGGWRAAITSWAQDHWEFYVRHPWVLQVSQARPVLGPNDYAVVETLLRILRETGLAPGALRRLTGALIQFVRGLAQTAAESRQALIETGRSDEEWWEERATLLTEVAPDFRERFPLVNWLAKEGAFTVEDGDGSYMEREGRETFRAGLAVLLDGVEAAMASQPAR
ncbi:TetR/AcrR family transcriptional regulator [Nonomuraea sp. NPDC005983]|uniref:TetR/AcrR family transcriptional regulator n=1 Tax=Nonomuraea sp. NPDC005983 TaxID=3155595 RepID=UPI0033B62951